MCSHSFPCASPGSLHELSPLYLQLGPHFSIQISLPIPAWSLQALVTSQLSTLSHMGSRASNPFPCSISMLLAQSMSRAQPQTCNISTHSPSTLQLTCPRTAPVLPPGTSLQLTLPASQAWILPPSLTILLASPWLPVIETESRPLKTEKVLLEGNSEFLQ